MPDEVRIAVVQQILMRTQLCRIDRYLTDTLTPVVGGTQEAAFFVRRPWAPRPVDHLGALTSLRGGVTNYLAGGVASQKCTID
jgi:hypothetical protein